MSACRYNSYSTPAAQGSASSSAYAQGPTAASFLGTKVAPGLYATAMELPGAAFPVAQD